MNIKSPAIKVMLMTTIVEPINSSRVDQDTLLSSTFVSFKNLTGFSNIFITLL